MSFKLLFLAIMSLVLSCSTKKESVAKSKSKTRSPICEINNIYAKHVQKFIQNDEALSLCLLNYIKIHKLKSLNAQTCVALTVNKDKARSVFTQGNLPEDLKWCTEQSLWKFDYSLLQLNEEFFITFPLTFTLE